MLRDAIGRRTLEQGRAQDSYTSGDGPEGSESRKLSPADMDNANGCLTSELRCGPPGHQGQVEVGTDPRGT